MVSMLDGSTLCYQAGDTCRPFTTQVAIPSNSLLPPSPGRGQSWLLIQSLASSAKGFQVGRDVKVLSLRRPDWPRLSHGWSGLVQDCMRHMITTLEAERRPGMPDVAPCANVPPPPPGRRRKYPSAGTPDGCCLSVRPSFPLFHQRIQLTRNGVSKARKGGTVLGAG